MKIHFQLAFRSNIELDCKIKLGKIWVRVGKTARERIEKPEGFVLLGFKKKKRKLSYM